MSVTWESKGRRTAAALVTGLAVAVGAGVTAAAPPKTVSATPLHLTAAQTKEWKAVVSNPFKRAEVVDKIAEAYRGVATVGVGTEPINMASGDVLDMASGISSGHFWVILSYADAMNGDVYAAGAECGILVAPIDPFVAAVLCGALTALLHSMVDGWGGGNAHGVWVDIWFWPPHITDGRW